VSGTLADRTTLRVGGAPRALLTAQTDAELIDAVVAADDRGEKILLIGGGSNLVIADEGFDGTAIVVGTQGITEAPDTCGGGWVTVAAGVNWDDFVVWSLAHDYRGVEALSGIPGSVGATPIQNVGAYGQEVSSVIARVDAFDRRTRQRTSIPVGDCGFGYRMSMFKAEPQRWVVLSVDFQFPRGDRSMPVAYAELAAALDIDLGSTARSADVRDAVLNLRRGKGMVLDSSDHDTWSVGSFFINPIVTPDAVPEGAPMWPQADGRVKTSAAWLVEHAGFARGFSIPGSRAGVSSKHTLALSNRGGATTAEILDLAGAIRDGVRETFGVTLEPEPTLIGCSLG